MFFRRYFKNLLSRNPGVYLFYTRIRYGARTEVRDWVLSVQTFMRLKNLNSFVFDFAG